MTRIDNEYTATLEHWWEDAEPGPVREGDLYLWRSRGGAYNIRRAAYARAEHDDRRVLHRARAPWESAHAVMASTEGNPQRRPFLKSPYGFDAWEDYRGRYSKDDLIDPVAMIEATPTPEMEAAAVRVHLNGAGIDPAETVAKRVAAAILYAGIAAA